MSKKVGILRFLGTNCDQDVWRAVENVELQPEWLWYQDHFSESDYCAFVLPGGFSYGDYLRCGAMAAKMPVMKSLSEAVNKGKPVLGICNGFQILCESGLLPGALIRNHNRHFIDEWVDLDLVSANKYWAGELNECSIPIAHGEGRYYVNEDELKKMEDNGQIWWRYRHNPNGSVSNIAGVMNHKKNVAALMPHPERAMFDWMGSQNGRIFFESLLR
ncbi:MAG: phosphoribosylformylglycinamidine synthase subunit PurQ [Bdellovibrionaceae bacterium]|nr:phosphoribosylformylglycinamidine synthase subunit PurQ [Pseudobdellovibrionaceae bacterium]